jgi:hypothetical protein
MSGSRFRGGERRGDRSGLGRRGRRLLRLKGGLSMDGGDPLRVVLVCVRLKSVGVHDEFGEAVWEFREVKYSGEIDW